MRRLHHWGRVFAGAVAGLAGVAGIVTLVVGGSLLTAAGFALDNSHPTLAVAVIAVVVVFAVLEGSYRVWDATDRRLQETKGRLKELDTVEARRSYLDEMDAEARGLAEDIESVSDSDYPMRRRTIDADIAHWEDGVRATLRRSFDEDDDVLFDSDEGIMTDHDRAQVAGSKGDALAYVARRRGRLAEIRAKIR